MGQNTFLFGIALYLFFGTGLTFPIKILLLVISWLIVGDGYRWCYLFSKTYKRDFRLLGRGLLVIRDMFAVKYFNQTYQEMFRKVVKKYPNKTLFINTTDNSQWTYSQMESFSNRIANYFLSVGYKKGDTIALFMESRPEYIGVWLGLAKIGVVPALINHNLRQQALIHTIKVADCKGVIYGLEVESALVEILPVLKESDKNFRCFFSKSGSGLPDTVHSDLEEAVNLDVALNEAKDCPEPDSIRKSILVTDPLLFIYTSGTTGLPKAVVIKHIRQLFAQVATHHGIGLTPDDTIYCYLPLYHSSGSQVATASGLLFGATTVMRKKFSASLFWKDCVKYNVTGTQYIGEICRYLLATPKVPEEGQHKIRIMFGNGLRPQIWKEFTTRFNIPNIAEFYGATEGNSNIVNIENHVGAVGFTGVWLPEFIHRLLLPLYIIKVDKETGEPIRNKDGLCIRCEPNEAGEFIGRIVRGDPIKDFQGYRDPEATKKKVLTDVFEKGDAYFRSGDILIQDELGWLYFKDRSGDTFRWRGENVSTLEVEATISNILELKDATAYGVEIPNVEGRAGMATILIKDSATEQETEMILEKLHRGLASKLPSYARPIFVRFSTELDLTGTFKLKKRTYQSEGFNPSTIDDPIYYLDTRAGRYFRLNNDIYHDICNGKMKI